MKTAADYAEFLKTPFWKDLSLKLRRAHGFRCQRCRKHDPCQAHHRFYRDDWFQTQIEDLECVCLACHKKEHGIVEVVVAVPVPAAPPVIIIPDGMTLKELRRLRSEQKLTREEFVRLRRLINPISKMARGPKRKRKRRKRRTKVTPNLVFKNRVYHFSSHRPRWVSRGTSSN